LSEPIQKERNSYIEPSDTAKNKSSIEHSNGKRERESRKSFTEEEFLRRKEGKSKKERAAMSPLREEMEEFEQGKKKDPCNTYNHCSVMY
jgi:hypothetical protein